MDLVWSFFYSEVDPVTSLYYMGPRMGHVTMFYTSWILDRASYTKETLSNFC